MTTQTVTKPGDSGVHVIGTTRGAKAPYRFCDSDQGVAETIKLRVATTESSTSHWSNSLSRLTGLNRTVWFCTKTGDGALTEVELKTVSEFDSEGSDANNSSSAIVSSDLRPEDCLSGQYRRRVNVRQNEDAERLPYVHVRARRGQATDSHSLAERLY